jgi:hypothetical protein
MRLLIRKVAVQILTFMPVKHDYIQEAQMLSLYLDSTLDATGVWIGTLPVESIGARQSNRNRPLER